MRTRMMLPSVDQLRGFGFALAFATLVMSPATGQERQRSGKTIHGKPVVIRTAYQAEISSDETPMEIIQPGIPQAVPQGALEPVPNVIEQHTLQAIPEQHHFFAAPQSGLWSGYQSDKQCGCVSTSCTQCNHSRPKSTVRKALGKLTAGIDIFLFGRAQSCGCDVCDSGCDVQPTCDGECDSIGASVSTHSGHIGESAEIKIQPIAPPATSRVPSAQPQDRMLQVPKPPADRKNPGTNQSNPFLDDPATARIRRGAKPAGFRR